MTNESLNKLSKDNILLLYRNLFFYTKEYVSYYGGFDWNDATIANFCQKHNIIKKRPPESGVQILFLLV